MVCRRRHQSRNGKQGERIKIPGNTAAMEIRNAKPEIRNKPKSQSRNAQNPQAWEFWDFAPGILKLFREPIAKPGAETELLNRGIRGIRGRRLKKETEKLKG